MSLYLRNATWIDPETFKATTTTIKVEEGPSGGMALDAHAPVECPPEDTVLDCTGRLVTPSFGCGHHHIYSALARGMPPAPKAPANFLEVLEYVWWRMDKKLDHDMIEASALVTGLYCAKNGVTFVIDHHASPFHLDGSLETIAKALDRVGLGHLLCYEISCRDGEEIKEKGLDETDAFLSSGRKGHVGLHASFTVDDDLLGRAVDLARKHKTGVHIHVAEGIEDQEHCARTYGKSASRTRACLICLCPSSGIASISMRKSATLSALLPAGSCRTPKATSTTTSGSDATTISPASCSARTVCTAT